jgi:hypothetical protein
LLKQRAHTTNPKLEQHKELPLHTCKLPLIQSTLPLNQCNDATWECNKEKKTCLLCPGWLDRLPWAVRPPLYDLTAWGAVRPPHETGLAPNFSKIAQITLNTFQMLSGAEIMHKLFPLVDNAWIKAKCEKFQHIASQIYKIHHKILHMSK